MSFTILEELRITLCEIQRIDKAEELDDLSQDICSNRVELIIYIKANLKRVLSDEASFGETGSNSTSCDRGTVTQSSSIQQLTADVELIQGGRLILVNVVLTNIPLYFLSMFKAPVWVIKRIEALRKRLLLEWRAQPPWQGMPGGLEKHLQDQEGRRFRHLGSCDHELSFTNQIVVEIPHST